MHAFYETILKEVNLRNCFIIIVTEGILQRPWPMIILNQIYFIWCDLHDGKFKVAYAGNGDMLPHVPNGKDTAYVEDQECQGYWFECAMKYFNLSNSECTWCASQKAISWNDSDY